MSHEPMTEHEIQQELSGYFFHGKPVPKQYWLADEPLDFTNLHHCLHLIRQVRGHNRRDAPNKEAK
jgi:hypothetical protein